MEYKGLENMIVGDVTGLKIAHPRLHFHDIHISSILFNNSPEFHLFYHEFLSIRFHAIHGALIKFTCYLYRRYLSLSLSLT